MSLSRLIVFYHTAWLHVSPVNMIILRPLMHVKPKLPLEVSLWVRIRYQYF